VTSMLNGQTKPYLGTILQLLQQNANVVKFLASDTTISPGSNMFSQSTPVPDIKHAHPAMTTWAARLVSEVVNREGGIMTQKSTGLHSRAQMSKATRIDELISWDTVSMLSLKHLEETTEEHAPAMSYILKAYTRKDTSRNYGNSSAPERETAVVCLNAMMALTFLRSNRASLYPLCRGIWLFAIKGPRTLFRVESRIAQSVAYSTVYTALGEMGKKKRKELQEAISAGEHFNTVTDNIQTWYKRRVHRIGRESQELKGFAGTAIKLEDYDPEAFNLKELLERQRKQERKTLTTEMILDDIDTDHLDHVATVEFLEVLFGFVPQLAALYRECLDDYIKAHVTKDPIPETRRTKIL
ncbi:hypothetical protein BDN70DRAFT_778301, partial [Pholiota conissans]